jgi:hypothetical protein
MSAPSLSPNVPTDTAVITSAANTVSPNGIVYPASTFPLSKDTFTQSKQLEAIATLESKFSPDRIRNHQFEWIRSSSETREDEWLPEYTYWKPPHKNKSATIEDIWKEWMFGMDGRLSVRDLMAGWEARWRRNNAAAKSEATRRKKLITLIERLSEKPNWSNALALRFLKDRYPIPSPSVPHLKNTRAFIEYLQKRDGNALEEILQDSNSYP